MHEKLRIFPEQKTASYNQKEQIMRYYPINEKAARTAWSMNHFGEFRSDEPGYMADVTTTPTTSRRKPQQSDPTTATRHSPWLTHSPRN